MNYAVSAPKLTAQFIESASSLIGYLKIKERVAMFLSALELRNIIESSFLPKRCQCTLTPDLSMTIKVYSDGATDQLDLCKSGINARHLNGSREINDLIAGLRSDIAHRTNEHHQTLHPDRKAL
jgi:hypothetical protein